MICHLFSLYSHCICNRERWLTLYSIITPLKYHVFKNIMENGAFAL